MSRGGIQLESLAFAIRDNKAGCFLQPFYCPNRAVAIRTVQSALRSDQQFQAYPGDFELYEIGTWQAWEGKLGGKPLESLGLLSNWCEEGTGE